MVQGFPGTSPLVGGKQVWSLYWVGRHSVAVIGASGGHHGALVCSWPSFMVTSIQVDGWLIGGDR